MILKFLRPKLVMGAPISALEKRGAALPLRSGPTLLNFPTSPIVRDLWQCFPPLGAAQSLRKLNLNLNLDLIPKETYL